MPTEPITTTFAMPQAYVQPLGLPLYWRDEQTGVLRDAVFAYIAHGAYPTGEPAPTPDQLRLLISYLQYMINAPCWLDESGTLAVLRYQAAHLSTVTEVHLWIMRCMEIGIDPL